MPTRLISAIALLLVVIRRLMSATIRVGPTTLVVTRVVSTLASAVAIAFAATR
jgi:hypothetical protein